MSNDQDQTDDDAQVSEASVMDESKGPEEIAPHDATGGDPSDESGRAQEGAAGPNAVPHENEESTDLG